ncbi:MAG: sulfatase-like hydrolase/transferase, partial [Acidimicrobiales bacterium]
HPRLARVVSRTAERTRLIESVVAAASEPADPQPEFFFVHSVLPHAPWERSPDGTLFTASADHDLPLDETGRWTTNEPDVIHAYQRHALQVGHVDRMIGDLVSGLKEAGRWDDTVVVVTADHGTSFTPGTSRRVGEDASLDEVYRVPLFVHTPGQDSATTDDRLTRLIDVVPTVMDVLDVSVDWDLEGFSLLDGGELPERIEVRSGNKTMTVAPTNEGALAAAARNAAWFPHGDGWQALAAPGPAGALVGRPVDSLDAGPAAGTATTDIDIGLVDRSTGFAPLLLPIAVEPTGAMPDRILVAIDGVVAGVGLPAQDEPGLFRAIVDPALLPDGSHTMRVFAWSDDAVDELALQAGSRLERTPDGWQVAGRVLAEEPPTDNRVAYVEQVSTDGPVIAVSGWAADLDRRAAPQFVALVDGDTVLGVDTALTIRSDVASQHGEDVARAAFSMRGPVTDHPEIVVVFEDSTMTIPAEELRDP